jgi:hypothetical protein
VQAPIWPEREQTKQVYLHDLMSDTKDSTDAHTAVPWGWVVDMLVNKTLLQCDIVLASSAYAWMLPRRILLGNLAYYLVPSKNC